MKTLNVSISGFVSWKGESYFIGDALSKSRLGLKSLDSGIHEVYFAGRLILAITPVDEGKV